MWGEKLEDGARRRAEGPERYTSLRGQDAACSKRAEQDRASHSLYQHHPIVNLKPGVPAEQRGKCPAGSPSALREHHTPTSTLVYDELLQQQRRLLSKLDVEEKKRKEAKEEGERPSLKERLLFFFFFYIKTEN